MKKALTFFLALAMLSAIFLTPALATDDSEDPPATTIDATNRSAAPIVDCGQDSSNSSRTYTVVDLGTNGSVSLDWSILSGQTIRSGYNYKTGSGKIVLRVNGSPAGSVIFYLFDTTDTMIGSSTTYVTSPGTTIVTFSNLFTNREYYIKTYNVSQYSITVTGSIAAA